MCFGGSKITNIPENLFKNNKNVINFSRSFSGCEGLTSLPENLFKNNVNVIDFSIAFNECKGLMSIPKNLFKSNVNVTNFFGTFENCENLTNIPEEIIEEVKKLREKGTCILSFMFHGCISASNYSSIPNYIKSY